MIAVEAYFTELGWTIASGGATNERSTYPALDKLLSAVGNTLKPKVFNVQEPTDLGAGRPDFALYSKSQIQKGQPRKGQMPERGVVEVKSVSDDAWMTAEGAQVTRYWGRYGLVIVTNTRDFVLVGNDRTGAPKILETLRLAKSEDDFLTKIQKPRAFANEVAQSLGEFLSRALSHQASIAEPKDLAWLLASYARDGLARVEASVDTQSLEGLKSALEAALGIRFEGEKGARFFHSTLVQTLFYGIFSAWVLWSRQSPLPTDRFDWKTAGWHLHVPVLRALFQQLSDPGRLRPLGLVEVLDWTAAALERVEHSAFFARFAKGEAVPYFYEPFLQAFDPELRKQLGVWYTPVEVVQYMVARVDMSLKKDLGISEGLAADNVHVLDPCCGTGAYLAEVLRRIASNLANQGLGALVGSRVKQAAISRVHGFEIMPAPFVIAHLQVGLILRELDAPLADDSERAGVSLTNALTGWGTEVNEVVPFEELQEERDRAEHVKRDSPILVILGNPPYNGFAGMAVNEERELTEAYRTTKRVRRPEGQGLNDLYVRFFRMAERRIAEKTGHGIVCFISNYSWLDGLSFTGMRERYLEAFDAIRIDCLNGDKYKTGKVAPDGSPDPSIFSTDAEPVGIQVGTAIATLVRGREHKPSSTISFRHLWGQTKRKELLETAEEDANALYETIKPTLPLGLPFVVTTVGDEWFDWPSLPDLFPVYFPGVKTSRDGFLIDVDLEKLKRRIGDYFDAALSHEQFSRQYPGVLESAQSLREELVKRGGPEESGFIRFAYRPFDIRWLYWEAEGGLLDRPRADYRPHVFDGNLWLTSAQHLRKGSDEPQTLFTEQMGSLHLIERGALLFPAWLREHGALKPNLKQAKLVGDKTIQHYIDRVGLGVEDLFHHVLAVLHDPAYREANAGALRMEWPRIPLPAWPDGDSEEAKSILVESATRGRELAALLDVDTAVPGVTKAPLQQGMGTLAVPATITGRHMMEKDFELSARWGRFGKGNAVMPGHGRLIARDYSPEERKGLGDSIAVLGARTFDIYLNDQAFWRNVPAAVWQYKLGGYQVLKKWLSYREHDILDRPLMPDEVQHFSDTARRIAAILLLTNQ
ncbi:MAG: N-6 DNA methylase [Gammaproteobacteria bacterium]|nr:N-6 DNA methylase [Gammaproteobacteria bacterium]